MEHNNPQLVEEFREHYHSTVKPLLDGGHFAAARSELSDTVNCMMLLGDAREIGIKSHCGIRFVAYLNMLYDQTEGGKAPDPDTVRGLEVYLAQTQLPLVRNRDSSVRG
ncbi:hypothetical protein ISS07_00535 [Candidatus Woesearchaeota archaeon]|nr:hypothetical protein [Candidatus Woesearchaeota archaeon]